MKPPEFYAHTEDCGCVATFKQESIDGGRGLRMQMWSLVACDEHEPDLRRFGPPEIDLYACCIHCAMNPNTKVCYDLEERGGHVYQCPDRWCIAGKRLRD